MKKKTLVKRRGNKAYLYLMPWFIGFAVFQVYPLLASLYYSFTDYNVLSKMNFIGFDNYIRLFTKDNEFANSVKVTVMYTLYTVPFKIIMSLLVALLLNKSRKGIGILRTIYYLPSLFGGSIAVAILWKLMFMDNGLINSVFTVFGFEGNSWLGNPKTALPTLSLLEAWQFGSSMVMFLAALKQVPESLYDAASIDGAGKIRQFMSVTFPQISPIVFFCIIMQSINALQNFTSAFTITDGGPLKSTYMLGLKLYNDGFLYFKMGYASATSWIIFMLIVGVTGILFASSKLWVFYGDEAD